MEFKKARSCTGLEPVTSLMTRFLKHSETRYVSHCSRSLRKDCIVKELVRLHLNPRASNCFYNDYSDFRCQIQEGVIIRRLNLERIRDVTSIDESVKGIEEVNLEDCSVLTDVSNLARSRKLCISNADVLRDVDCLRNLERLEFIECESLVDVSALGNIRHLSLIRCASVVDVSCLGNHVSLNLTSNSRITDVSSLGKVRSLCLMDCSSVTDVSSLGNVHYLDISSCEGISDVSALGNVHTLVMSGCYKIRDVSALINVHTLNLDNCWMVSDISNLKNVRNLSICRCDRIRDASGLTNLKFIDLKYSGITDVSQLGTVDKIVIDDKKYRGLLSNNPDLKEMRNIVVQKRFYTYDMYGEY